MTQHAPVVDRDGDGLADVDERRRYGTNPRVADTDGDGLPDGLEVACDGRLPGADPLSQDVYVELDSTRAAHVSNASVEQLEAAFARAPVENPDGTAGIDLHVVRSDGDLPAADEPVNSHARPGTANDLTDYRERYADHDGHGYYYLLAAEEVAYRGDDYYVGAGRQGVALIQPFTRSQITASLLMHELGHAFGLDRAQHGVDDERYGLAEYRSVMSYNGLYEVMTYSTGDGEVGRDEWAYVATERYQPAADCDGPSCLPAC